MLCVGLSLNVPRKSFSDVWRFETNAYSFTRTNEKHTEVRLGKEEEKKTPRQKY